MSGQYGDDSKLTDLAVEHNIVSDTANVQIIRSPSVVQVVTAQFTVQASASSATVTFLSTAAVANVIPVGAVLFGGPYLYTTVALASSGGATATVDAVSSKGVTAASIVPATAVGSSPFIADTSWVMGVANAPLTIPATGLKLSLDAGTLSAFTCFVIVPFIVV